MSLRAEEAPKVDFLVGFALLLAQLCALAEYGNPANIAVFTPRVLLQQTR